MIIYTQQDRIKISIRDIDLIIKPLSYKEKINWSNCISSNSGSQTENAISGLALLLKYCLKDIKGFTYSNGEPFVLEFDECGNITEDTIDSLLNLEISTDMTTVMYSLIKGVPTEITNSSGELIDYIKVTPLPSVPKKK